MERDVAALKDVLDHVKSENHKLYKRLLDKTEENARIKERIMFMRIEMDKKENDLRKVTQLYISVPHDLSSNECVHYNNL